MSGNTEKRKTAIKKNSKKRAARRKRRLIRFFAVFIILLVAVGVALSLTVFFPVKNITVGGESVYTEEEIISACGIVKDKDNIFLISEKGVMGKISKQLPESGKITVDKVLPDTVKITVETAVPAYFIVKDDAYYVADSEYKVTQALPDVPADCIQIETEKTPKTVLGEKLEFTDTDSELIERILALAKEKELGVTGVDVSDTIDLKFIVDGRIIVSLGNDVDIDYKITHFAAMYQKMDETAQGVANLASWTSSNAKSTFRDVKIDTLNFCELRNS